jgi:hypothetical protein
MRATVTVRPEAISAVKTKLIKKRKDLKPYKISVGIHEAEGQKPALDYSRRPSAVTLLYVALVHEYGAGNVPERSFLRSWFDSNANRLKDESTKAMRAEYRGDKGAVERTSKKWAEELMEWLRSDSAGLDALSPATIKARERAGLPTGPPLVATQQLVDAIRVIVSNQ